MKSVGYRRVFLERELVEAGRGLTREGDAKGRRVPWPPVCGGQIACSTRGEVGRLWCEEATGDSAQPRRRGSEGPAEE